jgi:hypothetical protein
MSIGDKFPDGAVLGIERRWTPTPDADEEFISRGLYISVAGDVECILKGETTSTVQSALAVGVWHSMRVKRIVSAGTTATGILLGE